MKQKYIMIIINIPSTISELKDMIKHHVSKKYRYNKALLNNIEKEICNELKSNYWSNDISEYMRKEFTDYPNGKIYKIVKKYKSQLK